MSGVVYEVPPLSRKKIRQYAQVFRQICGVTEDYFPVIEVLEERLPKEIEGFFFEPVSIEEMGNAHATTDPDNNHIRVRDDVYIGACNGEGRDRLTIAHEFGHLMMHGGLAFKRAVNDSDIPAYRSSEWQANAFGGELLVDIRAVQPHYDEATVCRLFGVSMTAAHTQLNAFKK